MRISRFMPQITISALVFGVLALTSCGTSPVASTSASPLVVASSDTPTIGKQNVSSLITCDDDSFPVVLDTPKLADHVFVIEACGSAGKAILIEDYTVQDGSLVSDGLISGPDAQVVFGAPCVATPDAINCQVTVVNETSDEQTESVLSITAMDQGFAWSLSN